MTDLVPQHHVCAERVEVHVPAHGHELRPRQVVERQVVLEDLAHGDDILGGGRLAGGAHLAEEFGEFFPLRVHGGDGEACFSEGVAQEVGHFFTGGPQVGGFGLFGFGAFVGGGEEIGEEPESDGEEQLGEGDDDEDGKGYQTAEILDRSL